MLAAQDLLQLSLTVYRNEAAERPLEICEHKFMRLQKRLLRRTRLYPVEGRFAGHRTHREDLQLDPFAIEIGVRLISIDLRQAHAIR